MKLRGVLFAFLFLIALGGCAGRGTRGNLHHHGGAARNLASKDSTTTVTTTASTTTSTTKSNPTPTTTASTGTTGASGGSTGSSSGPGSAAQWITYGGNFIRTAADTSSPAIGHSPTPVWTSPNLDGAVYGQPLVYGGLVLVGTENDTVYALSASNGSIVWSDHLATPVPSNRLPCGNISPVVGMTSTMVIDAPAHLLFASAEVSTGTGVGHMLYAIDLPSHGVSWGMDLDQPGWSASAQLQRAGLALDAGHVLVGFGGNYGDCGQYNGWVMGVPESGSGSLLAYRVPSSREGAIWAPAGITVDPSGNVFVATGNGSAGPGQPFDHGDSVIELSSTLGEMQYFAPSNWAQDSTGDADLGSTAPIWMGDGHVFIVGKEATAYLLDAASLGGIGGQLSSLDLCHSAGGNAYVSPDVFVVCDQGGQIIQVHTSASSLQKGWTWSSPSGGASSPIYAMGLLWCEDLGASKLYGIDPGSGATLYSVSVSVGGLEHFAAPAITGGTIVVAGARSVEAFG